MTEFDVYKHYQEVKDASDRIKPYIHKTPILRSTLLDERIGGGVQLFFKCENFNKTGSFKCRGAFNQCLQLPKSAKGVICHSSGNHGQALAYAAKSVGIPAVVVMPRNALIIKIDAVQHTYKAEVELVYPSNQARQERTDELIKERGLFLVHPSAPFKTIYGQGTASLELLDQVGALDYILCPCGGGGCLAGTAIASAGWAEEHGTIRAKVIGCEPIDASDAILSWRTGDFYQPENSQRTIADGLRTFLAGDAHTVITKTGLVDGMVLVSDNEIRNAADLIFQFLKIVVEPSSCTTLAAVIKLSKTYPGIFDMKKIGMILTGGNVSIEPFPHKKAKL